ncbi:hypothetical protein ACFL09_00090 [Planctomycetota bacterium]
MSRALLRVIIWVVVALACVLLGALWRAFRGSSRRAKKGAVVIAIAMAVLIVAYGVVRKQLSKRYRPSQELELQAVAEFVEGNRNRIELIAKRFDAIRALLGKDDWLPEGERTRRGTDQPTVVLWAHQLRGGEDPGLGGSSGELLVLEQMARWAKEPGSIAETYDGRSVDELADVLDRVDVPHIVVGRIGAVVPPKVDDLKFAKDGGVSGKFVAGRTTFSVAVVELRTGTIVAYGRGEATSSETVPITGAPGALMGDLRWQTHVAALKLGSRLVSGGD